jgi:hypothetical protein
MLANYWNYLLHLWKLDAFAEALEYARQVLDAMVVHNTSIEHIA